jgi:hypothetical protein
MPEIEGMPMAEFALALVWVALGIVAGFFVWSYIQPMLPASTAS